MPKLDYSAGALNVLNKFLRVESIVYVEGDDDVVFWGSVFQMFSKGSFEVLPSGSCTDLDKKIKLIEEGKVSALAARDSDYLDCKSKKSSCGKVVYTYGHSIENSLHCEHSMNAVAKIVCRTSVDHSEKCSEWLLHFTQAVFPLVRLEIANEIAGTGVEILGDNCSRFMTSQDSETVCHQKVNKKVIDALAAIPAEALDTADKIVNANGFDVRRWVRGHFLASGVQKFVSCCARRTGRRGSVAYENLFGQSVLCLQQVFKVRPEEARYYESSVQKALESVVL